MSYLFSIGLIVALLIITWIACTALRLNRSDTSAINMEVVVRNINLAFMLKAVVHTLQAYPRFNSSLSPDFEADISNARQGIVFELLPQFVFLHFAGSAQRQGINYNDVIR